MQNRKRFSIEEKYDVNPAYCDSFLTQTLWGFITGYVIAGGDSRAEAIRSYMQFFGVEDDIAVIDQLYMRTNAKMRSLVNNEKHIDLVGRLLRCEENEK